jgi:hypothetical protein
VAADLVDRYLALVQLVDLVEVAAERTLALVMQE